MMSIPWHFNKKENQLALQPLLHTCSEVLRPWDPATLAQMSQLTSEGYREVTLLGQSQKGDL